MVSAVSVAIRNAAAAMMGTQVRGSHQQRHRLCANSSQSSSPSLLCAPVQQSKKSGNVEGLTAAQLLQLANGPLLEHQKQANRKQANRLANSPTLLALVHLGTINVSHNDFGCRLTPNTTLCVS